MIYFQGELNDDSRKVVAVGKGEQYSSLRTQNTMYIRIITQAEYATYQAFDLFPEFEGYKPVAGDRFEAGYPRFNYFTWNLG